MAAPTDEQRRMASVMGLNPNDPSHWPLDEIDRFVWVKKEIPNIYGPRGRRLAIA